MTNNAKNKIVEPCQNDKSQSVALLYKAAAEALPELSRNPRKTPKLRARALLLEAECQKIAETSDMLNALTVWRNMVDYASTREPWQDADRARTEAESLEAWIKLMTRFCDSSSAPLMTHVALRVTWTRSRSWGLCPRVCARTNGHRGEAYASGCNYDKLSQAASTALQSATLTRFAIEHLDDLRGVYGFTTRYGLPTIDFACCGLSTLETILERAGWPKYQNLRRVYDRNGNTTGVFYCDK